MGFSLHPCLDLLVCVQFLWFWFYLFTTFYFMVYFLVNWLNYFVDINGLWINKSIHTNLKKKKRLDKLEIIPSEDTEYVLGFLQTDISPPTSVEVNNTLNKKNVFKILRETTQKSIANILVISRKSKVLIWREYINSDFRGQMLESALERVGPLPSSVYQRQ